MTVNKSGSYMIVWFSKIITVMRFYITENLKGLCVFGSCALTVVKSKAIKAVTIIFFHFFLLLQNESIHPHYLLFEAIFHP
jgi:hypothetical protein